MSRPRVAFFTHDGTGLGHLRRLCIAAGAIEDVCSCLVVTGQRAAGWMVPPSSEFVHLPSLDSIVAAKAGLWGRRPFIAEAAGRRLRGRLLRETLEAFDPDALVVDHLALGKNNELAPAVESLRARKYLVLRGVLDEPELAIPEVFGGGRGDAIEAHYDRVLVAADRPASEFASEYRLSSAIAEKVDVIGHLVEPVSSASIAAMRSERGIAPDGQWVVCSAGGGAVGGVLLEHCRAIVDDHPEVAFDLVHGPRARPGKEIRGAAAFRGRVVEWPENRSLALMHAAADVVVCQGGSNTLLEIYMGAARVVQVPYRAADNREQPLLAARMAEHMPLEVSTAEAVGAATTRALTAASPRPAELHAAAGRLDVNGARRFRDLLLSDLGSSAAS